jgi:hypothetical protein
MAVRNRLAEPDRTHARRREHPRPRPPREDRPALLAQLAGVVGDLTQRVADLTQHAANSEAENRRLRAETIELERLTARLQQLETADQWSLHQADITLRRLKVTVIVVTAALAVALSVMAITGLWSVNAVTILLGLVGAAEGVAFLTRLPTNR